MGASTLLTPCMSFGKVGSGQSVCTAPEGLFFPALRSPAFSIHIHRPNKPNHPAWPTHKDLGFSQGVDNFSDHLLGIFLRGNDRCILGKRDHVTAPRMLDQHPLLDQILTYAIRL